MSEAHWEASVQKVANAPSVIEVYLGLFVGFG